MSLPPSTPVHAWLRTMPGNVVAENEVAVWNLAWRAFTAAFGEVVTFLEFRSLVIGAGYPAGRRKNHGDGGDKYILALPQQVGGRPITRESFEPQ